MRPLTRAQIERFRKDGYLKFGRVVGRRQLAALRRALRDVIAEELAGRPSTPRPPEFSYGHDRAGSDRAGGSRAIHQFVNMWKVAPEYREAVNHPVITEAARQLIGAGHVRMWHDQVISKPPGDNAHFACHHDFYFWPLDRPTMVTCWLALDDATAANGCMHVIPGSHRDPRFQPAGCDLSADIGLSPVPLGAGAPGSLYDEVRTWMPDRTIPVELKAGECMFHHCLNYHMTPHNRTRGQRRAFVMIYMPDGTRFNRAQSPNHVCTNYLDLEDGQTMGGAEFPICGET